MKPSHLLSVDWLGELARDLIAPIYPLRAGIDVSPIRSVVIWCKAFSVEFAVAELG